MGLRAEGIPLLHLWEEITLVLLGQQRPPIERLPTINGMYELALNIDAMSTTLSPLTHIMESSLF